MSKGRLSDLERMILDRAEELGAEAWQRRGYAQPDNGPVRIGSFIQANVPNKRPKTGEIVDESREGTCWVVECGKARHRIEFHKSFCVKIRPSRAKGKKDKNAGYGGYVEDWDELERIKNGLLEDDI